MTEEKQLFRYRLYGLRLASELQLPELEIDLSPEVADVFIRLSRRIQGDAFGEKMPWFEKIGNSILVRAGVLGRFLVTGGSEIFVDSVHANNLSHGDEYLMSGDVRLYLLGSAIGAVLHQRRMLPLHVGSVIVHNSAWAFTGASGEGKSTITSWLHYRMGAAVVCDDVGSIEWRCGRPFLLAGPRRIKLWPDSLDFIGSDNMRKVRDLSGTQKCQIVLEKNFSPVASPLRALVVLSSVSDTKTPIFERLEGGRAFRACMDAVYRPEIAALTRNPAEIMNAIARLAESIEVYHLRRPRGLDIYAEGLAPLLNEMGIGVVVPSVHDSQT